MIFRALRSPGPQDHLPEGWPRCLPWAGLATLAGARGLPGRCTVGTRVSAGVLEVRRVSRSGGAGPSGCTSQGGGNCAGHLQTGLRLRVVLTGVCSLSGWSKTSQPLEAPEDNDGWSSAEELINSSDAEEEGRVGPRKLVTLGPPGRSARHHGLLGGRAPECDRGDAWLSWPLHGGGPLGRQGSPWLCAHPPPPSGSQQTGSLAHTRSALQTRRMPLGPSAKLCVRLSLTFWRTQPFECRFGA